jgi:hypothetical protein
VCASHEHVEIIVTWIHLHCELCVHNINVHMEVYIVSSDNFRVYASPCLRSSSPIFMF